MTNPDLTAASADSPAILRGRSRVGARRGESPAVKGRVTDSELKEFNEVIVETGRTQSELVREGVQLVIAKYRGQGERSWERWKAAVNQEMSRRGLSDADDWGWLEAFSAGMSPHRAVDQMVETSR